MEQLTNLVIADRELASISTVLVKLMNDTNATSTMLIDKSGQVVAVQGAGTRRNATTLGALLAGLVGGLLVTITGVNSGIGGPISIKAFMMVMIGGAGVIGGAIAGGLILGMLESVGLSVLHAYGDITYLVIFAALMVFLSLRPNGLMGKPWG